MENKFTDNEIIKALEWCEQFENNVVMCGRHGEKYTYTLQMMQIIKQALKDYNRQKAMIDGLIGDVTTYKVRWAKAEASKETAKSEARKEFWDKLWKKAYKIHGFEVIDVEDGDNLAKEMEGEDGLD